jgi:superfamily II DNA or RNA helicase
MSLRPYQSDIYAAARQVIATNRAICVQLATGGGKTPVMAAMCESVYGKNKRAWIVVPRRELLTQASAHLSKWGVPHGIINADTQESRAFKIHVVSKDTLIRRYGRIKNWPDLLIFDEAHLYLDRQIEIISHLPDTSKIIGMTATPERLDGRGLSEVYGALVSGPSIPWLTERGYLAPLRYFSPPLDGLADLHVRGTDYDEEELESLLQRRKIYGEVVGHYEKYGRGLPALGFCRSVKSAYQMAERFRDRGFKFYAVNAHTKEFPMPKRKLRELLTALRNGAIDGLTTADLILYGVDLPRVSYGFSVRPTLSRAVYMQLIGRLLRPSEGKEFAIFMDHCNMVLEHQDPAYPGVPLHYVPEISWNFDGREKRTRDKSAKNVVLCPHLDFMYCPAPHCSTCAYNPDKSVTDARRPMVIVPAQLQELKPVPLSERPVAERREIEDRIGAAVLEYKRDMGPGPVGELLKIAHELGYNPMWVYHRLTDENRHTVNFPLLHEICRLKGWKPGKAFFMARELRAHKSSREEYRRLMG